MTKERKIAVELVTLRMIITENDKGFYGLPSFIDRKEWLSWSNLTDEDMTLVENIYCDFYPWKRQVNTMIEMTKEKTISSKLKKYYFGFFSYWGNEIFFNLKCSMDNREFNLKILEKMIDIYDQEKAEKYEVSDVEERAKTLYEIAIYHISQFINFANEYLEEESNWELIQTASKLEMSLEEFREFEKEWKSMVNSDG